MIARDWSARVAQADAPTYAEHLKSQVLPALRGITGYAGAKLLQRATDDGADIIVITWWESLVAIRKFAGDDIEQAVVSDEIAPLLLDFAQRVRHYNVIVEDVVLPDDQD